jgi:hypothetical protein
VGAAKNGKNIFRSIGFGLFLKKLTFCALNFFRKRKFTKVHEAKKEEENEKRVANFLKTTDQTFTQDDEQEQQQQQQD